MTRLRRLTATAEAAASVVEENEDVAYSWVEVQESLAEVDVKALKVYLNIMDQPVLDGCCI